MTHSFTDADLTLAIQARRQDAEREFRARSVRYLADRDVIEIVTPQGGGFLIPRGWITALADVPLEQLAALELWPDGSAIVLESGDIQVSVHGLLTRLLPAMLPARPLAGLFAARGGQSTSSAKQISARQNGRKGGRPRKPADPAAA